MAACRLTVEIDDPSRPRIAGELITGMVVVKSDKDVRCKGLQVNCYWSTHGRGNTSRGDVETATIFDGEWQAGKEYRYPFKLATAAWPPTYYGTLINVSHYVEAKAKLPWTSDPKTLQEFSLVATDSPTDLAPTNNSAKKTNWLGWIFLPIAIVLLVMLFSFALILLPIIGIVAAGFWVIRVFIPRQITGSVELKTEPAILSPGQTLTGSCEFTPKRTSKINGINWTVRCIEKCVSGSGSKRTTHTHEALVKIFPLAKAGELVAGQLQKFDFAFQVPAGAPPTLKFSDNDITWSSEFRIDIPKWPDWIKSIPFVVKAAVRDATPQRSPTVVPAEEAVPEDDSWLTKVYQQVRQSAEDHERLNEVIEAVGSQVFAITVDIQEEVEEPLESDEDEDGTWVSAIDPVRKVPLVLFVPSHLKSSDMQWSNNWQGSANIIGLEDETGRVMMKLC